MVTLRVCLYSDVCVCKRKTDKNDVRVNQTLILRIEIKLSNYDVITGVVKEASISTHGIFVCVSQYVLFFITRYSIFIP